MRLLDQQVRTRDIKTGAKSDRSDWTTTSITEYVVTVTDDAGRIIGLTFDHSPTVAEIVAAIPATPPISDRSVIKDLAEWWALCQKVRIEAQARALPAAGIAKAQNAENAAWTALVAEVQARW
jgi:hypothetical protein